MEIAVNSHCAFAQTPSFLVPLWSRFAPLGAAEPLLPLVRRVVGEVDDTRAERPRVHEFQGFSIYAILEEALSTPQDQGMNHKPKLLKEVLAQQRLNEGAAAENRDVLTRPPLKLSDLLRDVPLD